jgi:PAS domain-containing protein
MDRPHRTLAGRCARHSSTRAVVKAAIEGREMQLEDVVRIADEASEVLQFNRALLQGAIENITQGISVVDQSLKLVAWNRRYLELFNYPDGLISVGRPIADIIRYNAERGLWALAKRKSTSPDACTGCARAVRTPPNGCSPMAE